MIEPSDETPTDKPTKKEKFNAEGLRNWIVPLSETAMTLREAYATLLAVGNDPTEVPMMVRLVENPEYHFGGLGFFKGRVTLEQHDYIHIVLGRGTTMIDEAFTIGFTMGSTDRVSSIEAGLFGWIAKTLYPSPYRFNERHTRVLRDAISLAFVSDVKPLCGVDFEPLLDKPLGEVRAAIGLEPALLQAYYEIEARRYPDSKASQRLVAHAPR